MRLPALLLALLVAAPSMGAERHRVRIVNEPGGAIAVSRDGGAAWTVVGRVVRPNRGLLKDIEDHEFTAADWAPMSSVAATAVNAIHFKVDAKKHATVFSIQPREFLETGEDYQKVSFYSPDSSLYTDVPAGEAIFGADAPFVGSPLMLERDGSLAPWPRGRAPAPGDVLVIPVDAPEGASGHLEFENRFGGRIFARSRDGSIRTLGQVLRPVTGVGRFAGTLYAGVGEIRANHPGVICISTSPLAEVGGLQIVPAIHASEPNLNYVRSKSVWMVVGPPGLLLPDLEGSAPLYRGHLRPRQGPVEVRIEGGGWQRIPELVGLQEGALMKVSHLRIPLE